jgi:hypothetical protein
MTLPSLAKDPRKYAADRKVCTRDLASILVTAYHPNGLLDIGIVDTDAEFRAAHLDVIPYEGGVAVPAPRYAFTYPNQPAANASATAVRLYSDKYDKVKAEILGTITINKVAMLKSLGPTIANELKHRIYGHQRVSLHQIMEHVMAKYGTLREMDIIELNAALKVPLTAIDDFIHWAGTTVSMIIAQLQVAGQVQQEADKISILQKGVEAHHPIRQCIAQAIVGTTVVSFH